VALGLGLFVQRVNYIQVEFFVFSGLELQPWAMAFLLLSFPLLLMHLCLMEANHMKQSNFKSNITLGESNMLGLCHAGDDQLHSRDAIWNRANQVGAVTHCKAAPSVLNVQLMFN
jgi:hypothetical protein